MSVALPDVNVLIALLDPQHVAHEVAGRWYRDQSPSGWASCPITQNGVVRVMSAPRYPNPVAPAIARGVLAEAVTAGAHRFWPCDISLLDETRIDAGRLHGTKQVTDAYLLALAVAHHGHLVTLDRSVVRSAVVDAAPDRLVVLT